jgi:hypothetical protein
MNMLAIANRRVHSRAIALGTAFLAVILFVSDVMAHGEGRVEFLERPGGERISGRLAGDAQGGFEFVPTQPGVPLRLETGAVIVCNGTGGDSLARPAPFRVLAGEAARLSGSLRVISETEVGLRVSWQAQPVTVRRPGVQAVTQRPGEAVVLSDGFEALEQSRWSTRGKVGPVEEPRLFDRRSLGIPAGGASLVHSLDEPLTAGRFDVAFFDEGSVVAGQQWSIELSFQGPSGHALVRVVLGWAEESLAVDAPNGLSLAVQRLARTPGWHRFSLRFTNEQTELSVDGKELAHGKGPDGPLTTIRLESSTAARDASAGGPPMKPLAGYFDDLQLIRFVEPPASLEIDIAQDEARLVAGDQLFGNVRGADGDRVRMSVEVDSITLSWSQVAGVYFRRLPALGAAVEGLLVRVEWRSGPGDAPADLDFAEGALAAVSDKTLTLSTSYSGVLAIPRGLVRKLVVEGRGRRLVIDSAAHHLGDEISRRDPVLDPPQPEGGTLERSIELSEVPELPCFLVLDVVQVVGESNDPHFSQRVRDGEFRTYAAVNGRRIDYVNRYVKTRNEAPERVAIPIPAGLLHPGKNTIRLELTGSAGKENQLDDLGVLQVALEFTDAPGRGPGLSGPGPP